MATTWATESNQNIQSSTRKLWIRSTIDQVLFKMPLYARLLMAHQVKQYGGNMITRPVLTDDLESLGQDYGENEPLEGGSKTILDTPHFTQKMFQLPVVYGVKEEFENAGGADTKVLDFVELLVQRAQYSTRKHMYKLMWDTAATPTSTDAGTKFQSVIQALDHDTQYGNLTRTLNSTPPYNGTRDWWQSADVNDFAIGTSTQGSGTAYAASIETFRKALDAVQENVEDDAEFLAVCGPTLHLKYKSWVQTEHGKTNMYGPMAKYGFDSIMIDNVELVKDPYLKDKNITDSHKWLFIFHIPSWNLVMHPKRTFAFTGFRWQGDIEGGYDRWLGRVMCRGNLCCWQPQSNIWLENVT